MNAFTCPFCQSEDIKLIKTHKYKGFVKRGWLCLKKKCGHSFVTYEKVEPGETYYKKERAA